MGIQPVRSLDQEALLFGMSRFEVEDPQKHLRWMFSYRWGSVPTKPPLPPPEIGSLI